MRALVLLLLSAITSSAFSAEYPVPNMEPGFCKDKEWKVEGGWSSLKDGQYGAENLDKGPGENKWKIAQRKNLMMIPVWCQDRSDPATTELLNAEFAIEGHSFVKIPVNDKNGKVKTTGLWIYK